MQIIIVAAKSENQVIGKENDLVWHLPADWRFFLSTIEDAYLLTGRKSYESAPGEEVFGANRQFVIITRNKEYTPPRGNVAHSIQAGIALAKKENAQRLCILGGAIIYEQAMEFANKMIITEVHAHFEGDAYFPEIDLKQWKESSRIRFSEDAENPFAYSFVVYERNIHLLKK